MKLVLPSISDLASFGGPKSNLTQVVDPVTDEDADDRNAAFANAAAVSHTLWRAWCSFYADNPPTDPVGTVHDAVWGGDVSVKPTVARTSAGLFTVTWPATITDLFAQSQSVSMRGSGALVNFAGTGGIVPHAITERNASPNVVTVRLYDLASGTPATPVDAASVLITVFLL